MSLPALLWAFEQRPADPLDKLLLILLADSASPDGRDANPFDESMKDRTGMTGLQIAQSVARLTDIGMLICDSAGPDAATSYRLDVEGTRRNGGAVINLFGETEEPRKPVARAVPTEAELKREFDAAWWPIYPLKRAKRAALKAFIKTRREGISLEQLVQGVEAYIVGKCGDYAWCHPATWLNQGRWDDEFEGGEGSMMNVDPNLEAHRRTMSRIRDDSFEIDPATTRRLFGGG